MRARGLVGIALALAGCGGGVAGPTSTPPPGTASGDGRCLLQLHGKGGTGGPPVVDAGVAVISPSGNAEAWGGREWRYFPEEDYEAAQEVVASSVDGCRRIIIGGFSNGAAFAAKILCRGETFGDRLERVVIDDPVVDRAVEGCTPDSSVDVVLYWTGALDPPARSGWSCAEADWTCEGDITIGIDAYAAALGVDVRSSPHSEHRWYLEAPELMDWGA